MAIIGSGYDRDVGGAQGTGFTGGSFPYKSEYQGAGVSLEMWLGWSQSTQEKWLQDYNRTDAQKTYYQDSDYAKVYRLKEKTDELIIDPIIDASGKLYEGTKFTLSTGLILGALYLALK